MKKYYGKENQVTEFTSSPMYRTCYKEFKILFNHTLTSIDKNKKCSCTAASAIWEENPTRNMIHTFEYDTTKNPDRGFGRPNKPEYSQNKLKHAIDDESKNFKLFTDTIANDCHLRTSVPIPDGGDCGLSAYSVLLRNDSEHLVYIFALRKTIGHSKIEAKD